MANALCRVDNVDIDEIGLLMNLRCAFSGADVNAGVGALDYVTVRLLAEDTVQTIRTKMSNAVQAYIVAQGWTVNASGLILPTFQKG